jgi:type I restriction enzyme S subunit
MIKQVKLKDIASYSKGKQINGKLLIENGAYDYLNGGINPSGRWNEYNTKSNTVTISEGGNSSGYVNFMTNPFWCGAHCYYLYDLKVPPKYLYYAIKSQEKRLMNLRTGATMPNIKKSTLSEFIFQIDDDTNKQNKIISILDSVSRIIMKRNQLLKEYDQLIKSIFVEMFDSETKETKLEDVCLGITDGSHNPPKGIDYSENIMLSSQNVHERQITFNNPRYLSDEDFQKENKRTQIKSGDVLLTIVGSIGRTAIVPNFFGNLTLQRSVAVLHPNFTRVTPTYLEESLFFIRHIIESESNGVAQKGIYLNQIRNLKIKYPPLLLQLKFESIVKKIEKLKIKVQHSISENQKMYGSLMQEYFG